MSNYSITDDFLDEMAMQGDEPLDLLVSSHLALNPPEAARELLDYLKNQKYLHENNLTELYRENLINAEVRDFFRARQQLPNEPWMDPHKLRSGGEFFRSRGVLSFMVLAFASLPCCYCWEDEARQLGKTGGLSDKNTIPRRLPETAQFVLDVVTENAFNANGNAIAAANKVRLIHSVIRQQMNATHSRNPDANTEFSGLWADSPTVALSQEFMSYTLLTFHHVVVQGLQRLGLRLEQDYIESYLHRWNIVGHLLGVDPRLVANLQTYDNTKKLYETAMARRRGPSPEGEKLLEALLWYTRNNIIARLFGKGWNPISVLPQILTEKLSGKEISQVLGLRISGRQRIVATPLWWIIRVIGFLQNFRLFQPITERVIQRATAWVWDLREDATGSAIIASSVDVGQKDRHVVLPPEVCEVWRYAKPLKPNNEQA